MTTNFDMSWYEKDQHELIEFLDNYANTLSSQYKHSDGLVTYSFYTDTVTLPQDRYSYLPPGESGKTTPFTEIEKQVFRAMVEYVSRFVNLEFREVPAGTGDIRILHANTTTGGYGSYPTDSGYQVLVVSDDQGYFESSQFLSTLWHEFGHNLGLKHPNSYQASDRGPFLPDSMDSELLSIMTYNSLFNSEFVMDTTFAPLDLYTLKEMYGESSKTDGLRWVVINRDEQHTGITSNLQDFIDNEFTFVITHKEDLVWLHGTTSQDVLDVSSLIKKEDNIGLLVDLHLGTISTSEANSNSYIQAYDFKNKSLVRVELTEIPEIRIFPERDPAERIDSLVLTSKSDSIIIGDYIESVYAGDGDDIFYNFNSNRLDGGDGFDSWEVGESLTEYQIKTLPTGFSLTSTSTDEILHFKDIEKIIFLDTTLTVEDSDIYQSLTNGNDIFDLATAKFSIDALGGNDFIKGYAVNPLKLDGGDGKDVWNIQGGINEYSFSQTKNGFTLANINQNISLIFFNIETLKFTNSTILIDTSPTANHLQAYRLYKAAFDRAPDLGGLGYWINSLDNGNTLVNVARGFLSSPEFQGLYGVGSSDQTFVRKLYNNVLDRDPDQGGYDFWLGHMANGMGRQDVLINFSESNENQNNVAEIVAHGVAYQEWIG